MAEKDVDTMEKIYSLAKRRGFVFQGSEIYGGLAGVWDYGPLGAELVYNIKESWWNHFVRCHDDVYGIQSSIIMPEAVRSASGHLEGFTDPMVECVKCKRRFRVDQLEDRNTCPDCGGAFGPEKTFNLLFPVEMGSTEGGTTTAYLRGELAQGMFVNFKNVIDSAHPKLPFGIAQIGRAFRNEIAPREFLFRTREFDIMELEYFVREEEWETHFETWRREMLAWIASVGIMPERVHEVEVGADDRAHYSKRTVDLEFDFPFGRRELAGLAYRTDFDLARHMEGSGVDIRYVAEDGTKIIPHVIEPTFGLGRAVLAVLASTYTEDTLGGEPRAYLRLPPHIAPYRAMVAPLLKNKPELVEKAKAVREELRKTIPNIAWDDNGNIGKRYRRQDEIGTPWCITIDFDTLGETPELRDTVTVRDRDTGEQKRVAIAELASILRA